MNSLHQFRNRRSPRNAAGFTLLEMMVVITIILILLSLATGRYQQSVVRAKEASLKQDLSVMSVAEVSDKLDLNSIKGREWYCQGTSAMSGAGLYEGLNWLTKKLEERRK